MCKYIDYFYTNYILHEIYLTTFITNIKNFIYVNNFSYISILDNRLLYSLYD